MEPGPVIAKTTRVLARQILVLRRKAGNPKEPARKRRFYRQEQRELRQRLMAILAAEEPDPLVDDISLSEIGISGEIPFPDHTSNVSDEQEAEEQLELREANATNGKIVIRQEGVGKRRASAFKVQPSLKMLRAGKELQEVLLPQEELMHRPTEDAVLEPAAEMIEPPPSVTAPASEPDPNLVPNGQGVRRARKQREPKTHRVAWNKGIPGSTRRKDSSAVSLKVSEPGPVTAPAPVQVTFDDPLVTLSRDQVVKLWGALVGGRLVIDETSYGPVYKVSLTSFTRILPALLERL